MICRNCGSSQIGEVCKYCGTKLYESYKEPWASMFNTTKIIRKDIQNDIHQEIHRRTI